MLYAIGVGDRLIDHSILSVTYHGEHLYCRKPMGLPVRTYVRTRTEADFFLGDEANCSLSQ